MAYNDDLPLGILQEMQRKFERYGYALTWLGRTVLLVDPNNKGTAWERDNPNLEHYLDTRYAAIVNKSAAQSR